MFRHSKIILPTLVIELGYEKNRKPHCAFGFYLAIKFNTQDCKPYTLKECKRVEVRIIWALDLPIKEFVSIIDKLTWSWKLKTPCIYIVWKTTMLVISLNSSFVGIVNMKYSRNKFHLFQFKLIHTQLAFKLHSSWTHSQSSCSQNKHTKKQEHKTWTRNQRTYIHNCGDIKKIIVDPI